MMKLEMELHIGASSTAAHVQHLVLLSSYYRKYSSWQQLTSKLAVQI